MKITKKQLSKLVEQVVSDHLKTGPTVKIKKIISVLQKLLDKMGNRPLGWARDIVEPVIKELEVLLIEVEDLEKRASDAAWRDNPGMGMERDF